MYEGVVADLQVRVQGTARRGGRGEVAAAQCVQSEPSPQTQRPTRVLPPPARELHSIDQQTGAGLHHCFPVLFVPVRHHWCLFSACQVSSHEDSRESVDG